MSLNAFIAVHDMLRLPLWEKHPRSLAPMLVLANAAEDEGYEWCAIKTLAKRAGMALSTFKVHLGILEEAGLVEVVNAGGQPKQIRDRLRGSRVRVRRVVFEAGSPVTGPEESPVTGPEESPVTGPLANLRRGSWKPGDRAGRKPGDRATDPACEPACVSEPLSVDGGGDLLSTSTQRAHVGGAGGDGLDCVESEPAGITEPTKSSKRTKKPPKPIPLHIIAAVDSVLPGVNDLHGRLNGTPPSKKEAAGYRQRIGSCLKHHGADETAVSARAAGLLAVLRWWDLPHKTAVAPGEPSCWYSAIGVNALLQVYPEKIDDLIGFARQGLEQAESRAKSMNSRRNSGNTGVYRQPDHYEDVTGMNKHETWHPPVEDILDAIGPDPKKKGGG